MPKIAKVLTDRQVAAKHHEGSKNAHSLHAVGGVPGLMLQVTINGGRSWVMRTPVSGKRKHFGLGSYPEVSLKEARYRAADIREAIGNGFDPIAEWNINKRKRALIDQGLSVTDARNQAQASWNNSYASASKVDAEVTFGKAVEDFLETMLDQFSNEKHQKQWRSTLDNYAVPIIGAKAVGAITVHDVQDVLEPIWATKTETATRLRGRIEKVLAWATVNGHRAGDNPARWKGNLDAILPKPSKVAKKSNQPAVQLDDVSGWWAALKKREGMAARALEFLTLCASRSGEVRGATWNEFSGLDGDNPLWTIPAGRMKAGNEHRVPLTKDAIAILNALPRTKDDNTVFFAPRGGPLSDMTISAVMRRMHEGQVKLGNKGWADRQSGRAAVPHGLRSTFRDWATERSDHPRDMAEIALAHNVGSAVERAYRRGDMLDKRRAMMADWAAFLRGAA